MNDTISTAVYKMIIQSILQVWHSTFKQNSNTHVYTASTHAGTADMSTESFKDNTPVEKESLISGRKANIPEMYCNEITTFRKRNSSIYFREELEFARDTSGNDVKPVRMNYRKLCIVKERQNLRQIPIIMLLLYVASASATRSIDLEPPKNYTVFQNDTPAIFYCYGIGFGTGAVVSWSLNRTGYGTEHAQMGITYVIDPPTGTTVSSHLIVPSNSAINNNTQVICRTADVTFSNVLTSQPANLTIQGPLQPPTNFNVNISKTSNTTFLLSWGAPFSLDVTDSLDIFYYTLCTNITTYGCRNISSNPDCIFNGTNQCNSSVDFTDHSLNGTNGGTNKTIMDYGDPIHFTFFAVNGAGNGSKANFNFTYMYFFKQESGENLAPSQTEPESTNIVPTTTILSRNRQTENLILEVAVPVVVCILIVGVLIIVIVIKRRGTKRAPSEPSVNVELYSYATHQVNTTVTAKNQTKAIQYHQCMASRVECDSEDNGNESKDSTWCPPSGQAQQTTTDHIATGVDLAAKHADVSEFTQRKLLEHTEHHWTLSSDLSDIKSFIQEPYYNPCEVTDDISFLFHSPVFAFASIITPQCTKLSPTVLVLECNATSLNAASHHNVVQKSLVITADVNIATSDTIETECNSDNSHILKDDQNYADSTNDNQDDSVSNKVAGQIIFEAKTAFVENGPPWMPLTVNILQYEWLPWDTSPFYTTSKASPYRNSGLKNGAEKYQCLGDTIIGFGSTKNMHNFSCASYLGFLQVYNDIM